MNKIITKFTKWLLTEGDHACHTEGDVEGCHKNQNNSNNSCHHVTTVCH
jgi:hypothetical protein